MSVQLLDPAGLVTPELYHQVSVATGTRIVSVAGQTAVDAEGRPVGGDDLAAQTEQAVLNLATALRAAGAGLDDVASMTVYVTDWTPDRAPQLVEGFGRAAAQLGGLPSAPTSLVGVQVLFAPGVLVEISATAVTA